jgi:hypothetical protein
MARSRGLGDVYKRQESGCAPAGFSIVVMPDVPSSKYVV